MEDNNQLDAWHFGAAIKTGVTLVDFKAPWCEPWHVQGPIIKKIAKQFRGKMKIAIDTLIGMVSKSIIEDTMRKCLLESEFAEVVIAQ